MIAIWIIISAVTLSYILLIIFFQTGLNRIKALSYQENCPQPSVSVIVPVRNEEENIRELLNSISEQDYPAENFELIIVDDHSQDKTLDILTATDNHPKNVTLVQLEESSGKKAAIKAGVLQSNHDILITVDADCHFGQAWLSAMVSSYVQNNAKMLIGPVLFAPAKSVFSKMLSLEFLSLVGITAGAAGMKQAIMGNGANLMFDRQQYMDFIAEDSPDTPSGDDVFFILWLKRHHNEDIHFVLSNQAVALTKAPASLKEFIWQRFRWTSKSRYYKDTSIIVTALIVYIFNLLILLLLVGSAFINNFFLLFLIMFLSKCLIDIIFLTDVTQKFRQGSLLRVFIPVQIVYPFYIIFTATFGHLMKSRWKGRR